MTSLLELKEKLKSFYGKYDIYIKPFFKFIVALSVFLIINGNIGYMKRLSGLSVTLVLALVCSILPMYTMLLLAAVVILLHLYALSLEVAVTALVIFILVFLLYFRFAPKDVFYTALMPVCCHFNLGPVIPMAAGLLGEVYSVISVVCGTIVWFFLKGVKENASTLGNSSDDTAVTSKFAATLNQLIGNKEMYLVVITFLAVTLLVLLIRRLPIDHAWTIAVIIGALVNFIVLFAGYLLLGISGRITGLVIGTLCSAVIAFVLEFLFFNLDYSRTERVQFEDDEYYYYVKAVPKMYVAGKEKHVKKFNTKERRSRETERITRKQLSEDMDISEDLLD